MHHIDVTTGINPACMLISVLSNFNIAERFDYSSIQVWPKASVFKHFKTQIIQLCLFAFYSVETFMNRHS